MLRWYGENTGHHLILAKNHAAVRTAVHAHLHSEDDHLEQLRGYWEIDVQAPSVKMEELAFRWHEMSVRGQFWDSVASRIRPMLIEGTKTDVARLCERHSLEDWSCEHCHNGVVITVSDRESFFLARRAAYEKANEMYRDRTKWSSSRATPAASHKGLKWACPDFGHHSSGVSLYDFQMPALPETERVASYSHTSVFEEPLFFYTEVQALDTSDLDQLLDANAEYWRGVQERQRLEFEAERDQARDRDRAAFLAMLRGEP